MSVDYANHSVWEDGQGEDPLLDYWGEDGVGDRTWHTNFYLRYDGSVWAIRGNTIVRDTDTAYPVGPNEWARWRATGMLRAMGADLLLRKPSRKLLPKCIVVVTNFRRDRCGPGALREYVWCIRFKLQDCEHLPRMNGRGVFFLWPGEAFAPAPPVPPPASVAGPARQ